MIRRINLFAGPGVGKSSLASYLFSELRKLDVNVELVTEVIKPLAYQGYKLKGYDQLDIFTKQLRREEDFLKNGVNLIITDSPLHLNVFYSRLSNDSYWTYLQRFAFDFDAEYPTHNIFLKRSRKFRFLNAGRYETYEEALKKDIIMKDYVKDLINYEYCVTQRKKILTNILHNCI
jgi:hypothetical protein